VEYGATVATSTLGGGKGGTILLRGDRILVANGGSVDSTSLPHPGTRRPNGDAGDVTLVAEKSIEVRNPEFGVSRVSSFSLGSGAAGAVALHAPRIAIDAGAVVLGAPQIDVRDGGEVSAESAPDLGARLQLFSTGILKGLIGAVPDAASGDAGGVALEASHLVHLDAGHITTDNFFQFPDSVVSAASGNPDLSGTVEIHSPAVNLAGTLAELPASFLDAASQMRERCAARRSGERAGSFAVRGPGGIPAEPDGWLPAPLLPAAEAATSAAPGRPVLVASLSGPLLAHAACP